MWICVCLTGLLLLMAGGRVVADARETGWLALPQAALVAAEWAWFIYVVHLTRQIIREY
jgi:hypothetical protein